MRGIAKLCCAAGFVAVMPVAANAQTCTGYLYGDNSRLSSILTGMGSARRAPVIRSYSISTATGRRSC